MTFETRFRAWNPIDGGRFICQAQQSGSDTIDPPTEEEYSKFGGITINNAIEWGFFTNAGGVFKTPSAVCCNLLSRSGKTNQWNGPSHIYLEINGTWIKMSTRR